MFTGKHLIQFWAQTTWFIALFSADTGMHAYVEAIVELLGAQSISEGLRGQSFVKCLAGAFAASGVIARVGFGTARQFGINNLRVQ